MIQVQTELNVADNTGAKRIECIKVLGGLSKGGFDNFGNYTFGVKEHIIFPEVNFDKVDKIRGLDISIVIKSISKEHSLELLKKFNFPFKTERSN